MKRLLLISIFLTALVCFLPSNAQEPKKNKIQNLEDKSKLKVPKPLMRDYEFLRQRIFPYQSIPEGARVKAIQQAENLVHSKNIQAMMQAQQPEWEPIGPYEIGGRVKSIVCHPTIQDLVYIGAAAGGIWKTTDGGNSWTPIFDFENGIAFGALAIDANNPDIIYAGTGEAVIGFSTDFRATPSYLGSGVYKSIDAGNTWKLIGLTNVGAFSKLYVHPLNSNLILASSVRSSGGLYKSTDAGSSWISVYDGQVSDLSINTANENEYIIGVTNDGVYYTDDGGTSWTRRSAGIGSGVGRVSVQFAPSDPNYVYALIEINEIGTIYRSMNRAVAWQQIYQGGSSFFNGQGMYDNFISVHPTKPAVALAGGIDVYRTITTGGNWSNVTMSYSGGNVHPDQHCATFNPVDPNIVYLGNDGGMYKSFDAGNTWTEINNNLQITQFYALAIDHTQENINYGGTQDNGTLGKTSNGSWTRVAGGDGFRCIVDPDNSNILYGSYYYGNMFKLNMTNWTSQTITTGIPTNDEGAWCAPFVIDYTDSYIMYHGRYALYASYNKGQSWSAMTPRYNAQFSSISSSRANLEIIWAGNEIGEVIVSSDAGDSWDKVSENGLISRFVTDIETSYLDDKTAYITYSGYGSGHVFMTTDLGKNWQNISQTLPDVPTTAIAINPNNEDNLFVGTDIGVFATYDRGLTWFPYGRKLPKSPVMDLAFRSTLLTGELILRCATHGRSMWEVNVPDDIVIEPEITSPGGGEIFVSGTNQTVSWYGFTLPVNVFYSIDDGQTWVQIAENVNSNSLIWKVPNRSTYNARIKVISANNSTQERISNTFTIKIKEKGSILQSGSVSYIPYGIAWDGKDGLWSTSFQSNKLKKLNCDNFSTIKEFILPGDSLYTDLTIDRAKGLIYLHRMWSTSAGGGVIFVVDTNGTLIKQMNSPASAYPIGLELVDGKLVVGDRDGQRMLTVMDPNNGYKEYQVKNPYQATYGPRGICYDGSKFLYQACTNFPGAGALQAAYIIKIDKVDLGTEVDRMELISTDGPINARGIEYDTRDHNFWVSDYGGNIYKIAGFETIADVDNSTIEQNYPDIDVKIFPNPMSDYSTISFSMLNKSANVRIEIYNLLGQSIGTFFDSYLNVNDANFIQLERNKLSQGVYSIIFYVDGIQRETKKLIISN